MARHKNRREKKQSNLLDDELPKVSKLPKLPKLRTDTTNCGILDVRKEITEAELASKKRNDEPLNFCQERQRIAEKVIQKCGYDNITVDARHVPYLNQRCINPIDSDGVEISDEFRNSSYQVREMPLQSSAEREIELDKKRQAMLETKDRQVKSLRKYKKIKLEENHESRVASETDQEEKNKKRHTKKLNKSREEDRFVSYEISEDPAWQRHMATSHMAVHDNYTQLPQSKYHILPPIKEHQQVQKQTEVIQVNVADDRSDSNCSDIELDKGYMPGHAEIVRKDKKLQQELKLDLSFTKTPEPRRKANKISKQSKSQDNVTTRRLGNTSERL